MPESEPAPASWLGWAAGLVLLIATIALVVQLSTSNDEFSRYNPSWNGTSAYFATLDARGAPTVADPALLAGHPGATLLVVAPGRPPDPAEGAAYRDFVAGGGTLVLADDFGAGNALLEAVGSGMRLDQGNLSSVERAFEVPGAPLGFPVEGESLAAGLGAVVFDHPAGVVGGTPFLVTSPLSWMDADGNGRADPDEPLGEAALAASEQVGAGRVIVVGDSSLFVNAMQGLREGDNAALLGRLVPDGVLVDARLARTASAGGPVGAVLWLRGVPLLIAAATAGALVALAWWLGRRRTA